MCTWKTIFVHRFLQFYNYHQKNGSFSERGQSHMKPHPLYLHIKLYAACIDDSPHHSQCFLQGRRAPLTLFHWKRHDVQVKLQETKIEHSKHSAFNFTVSDGDSLHCFHTKAEILINWNFLLISKEIHHIKCRDFVFVTSWVSF